MCSAVSWLAGSAWSSNRPDQLNLSGTGSYSGGTTINNGTLQLGSNTALPVQSNLYVPGGMLDLNR